VNIVLVLFFLLPFPYYILDAILTYIGIRKGVAKEINPLLRFLNKNASFIFLIKTLFLIFFLYITWYYFVNKGYAYVKESFLYILNFLYYTTIIYFLICFVNIYVIWGERGILFILLLGSLHLFIWIYYIKPWLSLYLSLL